MGCLSWPQKKALKLAFKLIEKKIDKKDSLNSTGSLSNNGNPYGNNQHLPSESNSSSSNENIKLAMNLITKVLDLWDSSLMFLFLFAYKFLFFFSFILILLIYKLFYLIAVFDKLELQFIWSLLYLSITILNYHLNFILVFILFW